MKTVHGFGINDGKYPSKINGKIIKQYSLWRAMIGRCYHRTENRKIVYRSYNNCRVSEFFKYYSNFYEWVGDQVGFNVEGFDLDKDLLFKGGSIYSESNCVFLPSEINTAIQYGRSDRGEYPIGVRKHNQTGRFVARMRRGGIDVYIGIYKTPEEAFLNYKESKEDYLRFLANKWVGKIDDRAYQALMNYEVCITD